MARLSPGKYTRGWESVRHYLTMLRLSIVAHVMVSIVGGLLVGILWLYFLQNEKAQDDFGGYVKASILASISEDRRANYDIGNGPEPVASIVAKEHFRRSSFGGRTFGFLMKQAGFRVGVVAIVIAILFGLLVGAHGKSMTKEERKRGAKIVVLDEEEARHRRRRTALLALGSLVLGFSVHLACLGSDGRRFLGDYYWSGINSTLGLVADVSSPDGAGALAWYYHPEPGFRPSDEVRDWLKMNVYGGFGPLLIFLLALAGSVFFFAGGLAFMRFRARGTSKDSDIKVGGVGLLKGAECKHLLFFGSPGSGKSTAIKEVLDQVRSSGKRAIVYDPSGEFIESYYREGQDVILNPLDARYPAWNLWAEIRSKTDFATLARSIFPGGGKDPFWELAGATLFETVTEKLWEEKRTTNAELYRVLTTSSVQDLAGWLKGTAAARFLDDSAGAMPSNVLATMTSKLAAVEVLPDTEGKPFSIRDWVETESDSWMFLAMRQEHQASLRPLVSLWCDIASSAVLSLKPDRSRRVWFVLDELPSLAKLPALHPLLAQGRKHGAAVLLGLQAMPQLREIYGHDGAAGLASQPQTWLILRTVEPDTAQWLEKAVGQSEIDETRESVSMGAQAVRDGVSFQQNVHMKAVAMATEIMALPDLEGYLKTPGKEAVYKVKIEVKDRPTVAPIFVPR
jgi:type IV conjugative transfer system coupling protein TraD